jgi:putative restriction endonuclease
MSIKAYKEHFSSLNTARKLGRPAPHKAILLLSMMELIENGRINDNRIELTEILEETFLKLWKRYVGSSMIFQPKVATPFWHLQHEPFWNLYLNDGKDLNTITSPYSVKRLREHTHAIIDKELFELMKNEDNRAALRVTLIGTYLQVQHNSALPILVGALVILAA